MTTTATENRTTAPTRWLLDPERSTIEFAVETFWGLSTVHGRFDRFEGSYEQELGDAAIDLAVDVDSLDTGNRTRDEHLRSEAFFHAEDHPQVRFRSARVHEVEDGLLHVGGRLEAAGKSIWLEFPAFVRTVDDGLEIEATTTVDQRELGMSGGPLGMIRPPVRLHVDAELNR